MLQRQTRSPEHVKQPARLHRYTAVAWQACGDHICVRVSLRRSAQRLRNAATWFFFILRFSQSVQKRMGKEGVRGVKDITVYLFAVVFTVIILYYASSIRLGHYFLPFQHYCNTVENVVLQISPFVNSASRGFLNYWGRYLSSVIHT